ncbi:MAG TPA: hypothetical protein DDZ51_07255 [Planctomycetaceae bacterium]|nr:hypothetical protein [Planctomycetaceae bacterium]
MIMNKTKLFCSVIRPVAMLLMFVGFATTPADSHADSLSRLLKRAARVADDIPLNQTDDALAKLKKLPNFRASDEAMTAAGEAALKNSDDIRAAAIMIDGAKRIDAAISDLAIRSDLIRRGGGDAIAAAGVRVGAADELLYLDRYLARTDFQLADGFRRPIMADFAAVAADDAHWTFWQRYVAPNKKLWAGGTALAVYLVAPEMWHDGAGNLTEKGLELAGDLGGELLGGAIRGLRQGGENFGGKVAAEIPPLGSTSFVGWIGMIAIVAVLTILTLAALRRRVVEMFKRLVLGKSSNQTEADSF